ncbi:MULTISPECIES: HDIG domain-containing metalloprotein [Oceanobacillus]|uniref:Cyclic-di-AMP phosphodiesterase PgpH n=1 Tax=Oceanobacillus kimchii TaxID=746691 RepID=A0ABQ5TLH8_9BACI|nr:HDIG domain-containing metalloprotein [Oceanobacillus kimchii]MCT1575870.1 HDIG domain-containing protein [Oceanobacillus kimchii]MCT2135507.1 HDIG domain-containing protein [Oceanobacillus kimchii]GLO66611.1 cyclic-di-AMP phosphodiesterase PgpH [Oceanobacillus kimchii]
MKEKWAERYQLFKQKHSTIIIIPPVILLGLFLFILMWDNVQTETYEIERFSNANQTIRSPITIEDEGETERRTREAVQSVPDRYDISEEVTEERLNYITELFDAVDKFYEEQVEEANEDNDVPPLTDQDKAIQLKQLLSNEISNEINDQTLITILSQSDEDLQQAQTIFMEALEETLNRGVRTENIQTAIANVEQTVEYSDFNEELTLALNDLATFAVTENSFFDYEKTSQARKDAATTVDPVMIRAGEVIVREGQTITNEIYEKLDIVGVLDSERNIFPLLGLSLLIAIITIFIAVELYRNAKENDWNMKKVAAVLLISVVTVLLMKVTSIYTTQSNQLFFVTPIATAAILHKLLLHERIAIKMAIFYSIIATVIFNGQIAGALNVEVGIYFLVSQVAAVGLLSNVKDRYAILKSAFGMSLIHIATILLFIFLSFEKYTWMDIIIQSSFGIISAFFAAVLAMGMLPLFESLLGVLSDMKLLQLSNPNQPLLKKLLTEAPGTYHHSVMVANISETACEAIGANGLLARVGAYYHDIGKTVRPQYFIENQVAMRNPHDFMPPKKSADIIIRHPYDGADMLKEHRMPKEIIDIAKQHHSNSLLKYFYMKEKEEKPEVEESEFRYPGPKPKLKETAIICICDSVEAAVRSLKEPTEEKIEAIVSGIIRDKVADGQLNDSPLTLKELTVIQFTICESLKGIFHSRIQYPKEEEN